MKNRHAGMEAREVERIIRGIEGGRMEEMAVVKLFFVTHCPPSLPKPASEYSHSLLASCISCRPWESTHPRTSRHS